MYCYNIFLFSFDDFVRGFVKSLPVVAHFCWLLPHYSDRCPMSLSLYFMRFKFIRCLLVCLIWRSSVWFYIDIHADRSIFAGFRNDMTAPETLPLIVIANEWNHCKYINCNWLLWFRWMSECICWFVCVFRDKLLSHIISFSFHSSMKLQIVPFFCNAHGH